MTTFNRGDIVLTEIVFTDGSATKKRPALVISGTKYNQAREEVIVAAISSNTKRRIFGDIIIQNWQEAGLLYPSAMTGIFFTVRKTLIDKRLGKLQKVDLKAVERNIREILERNSDPEGKKRL